ncbi:hypothetical protein ACI3L1_09265 [Deinococcus sp. SM5_A1]|uniref:hypothetical protein n=1 Tax=Deinococcus sp. SM5_A1 TaxID=3379094 RepID=UPI00385AEFB9
MSRATSVAIGTRLRYAGREWVIAAEPGLNVRLRDDQGQELNTTWASIIQASDYAVVSEEEPTHHPFELSFEALPFDIKAAARKLERHVLEILTGAQEPGGSLNSDYDASYSLNQRVQKKAEELKALGPEEAISERQLKRYLAAYQQNHRGVFGLVDRRHLRLQTPFSADDQVVMAAIDAVHTSLEGHSDVSLDEVRRLTRNELKRRGQLTEDQPGAGKVRMPQRTRFCELLRAVAPTRFKTARQRDSILANLKKRPFGRATADRPGQVIVLDYTNFDLIVISEVDGSEIRLRLLIALDLWSRAIVSWDLVEVEPRGVDAARLVTGVIFPRLWHPSWPESAKWPYTGVPQEVVLHHFGLSADLHLAGPPPLAIEELVLDGGRVFVSAQLEVLADQFGITIRLARPYKGSDKSHIERLFRTIRIRFLEALRGYTGPNVQHRGRKVLGHHFRAELMAMIGEFITTEYNNRAHDSCYHPLRPKVKLSPNQMLELGLQTQGFLMVPRSRNAYYASLRQVRVRAIKENGIHLKHRRYDGPELNPYRGGQPPYNLQDNRRDGTPRDRRWLVLVDDRDPSYIFFPDPHSAGDETVYHAIAWVDADHIGRPFMDALADASHDAYEEGGFDNHAEIDARRDARRDQYDSQIEAQGKERRDAIATLQSLNSRPAGKGGKLPRTERNEQARQKAAQLDREVQLGANAPAPLPPTPPPPPPHTAALNLADLTSGVHTVNLDDDINPWKLMDDLDDLDDTEEET